MRKAKIYKPSKTAMQSGMRNTRNWLLMFDSLNLGINPLTGWNTSKDTMSEVKLEFLSQDNGINPLMGWETSTDTMSEVKLFFESKELAINYAKNNNH